jgi:AcrR family transcriptional regulator
MSEEAAAVVQPLDLAIAQACNEVSYNLNGQRLGRKGRETRERIVRAAIDALGEGGEEPFTLSAVARRASLGMSSLYNYFTDLSELMVAVLEPVMASAQIDYLALLDDYWPDDELGARCQQFWSRYSDFWNSHAAILHQRNRMSDAGDERMLRCRLEAGYPLMEGICRQLGAGDGSPSTDIEQSMASVLATMLERTVTVQSQPSYRNVIRGPMARVTRGLGMAGAQLLALAAEDCRRRRLAHTASPRLKSL